MLRCLRERFNKSFRNPMNVRAFSLNKRSSTQTQQHCCDKNRSVPSLSRRATGKMRFCDYMLFDVHDVRMLHLVLWRSCELVGSRKCLLRVCWTFDKRATGVFVLLFCLCVHGVIESMTEQFNSCLFGLRDCESDISVELQNDWEVGRRRLWVNVMGLPDSWWQCDDVC